MSSKDWDPNLTPEQNYVLRQEGTESPGSSPLNNEKREGSYHCVGCGTKLFSSSMKFDSGSGWPSFFSSLPDVSKWILWHIKPNSMVISITSVKRDYKVNNLEGLLTSKVGLFMFEGKYKINFAMLLLKN